MLDPATAVLGFSARTRQRILKLARTIADLNGDAQVVEPHVSEAVTYRAFDRSQQETLTGMPAVGSRA